MREEKEGESGGVGRQRKMGGETVVIVTGHKHLVTVIYLKEQTI